MSQLKSIKLEEATGQTAKLYSAIKGALGGVPNLFQGLGISPRALEAYLNIGGALKGGLLSGQDQEAIALTVSAKNGCNYCQAAHTVLGKMNGLTEDEMKSNRSGSSKDTKRVHLIRLVSEIVENKGSVSFSALQAFKSAGYTDEHIPEILLTVVQTAFTNYYNELNKTDLDFPAAPKL